MAGELVPTVLLPRYTTLVGGGTWFPTVPIDVSEFQKGVITVWRGPIQAGAGSIMLTFQESSDRENWTECTGSQTHVSPNAGQEVVARPSFLKRWFRVFVEFVAGLEQSRVTCWAAGHLEKREE